LVFGWSRDVRGGGRSVREHPILPFCVFSFGQAAVDGNGVPEDDA
jgi:hypothetical protein